MIIKVQPSLNTIPEETMVLIYDKDRTVRIEQHITPNLVHMLGGRPKVYFNARVVDGKLEIGNEVQHQQW